MTRTCHNTRVFFSTSHLRNNNVEGARARNADKIGQIKVLGGIGSLKLRIDSELSLTVITPHKDFSVLDLVSHLVHLLLLVVLCVELLWSVERGQIIVAIFFVGKGSFVSAILGRSLVVVILRQI